MLSASLILAVCLSAALAEYTTVTIATSVNQPIDENGKDDEDERVDFPSEPAAWLACDGVAARLPDDTVEFGQFHIYKRAGSRFIRPQGVRSGDELNLGVELRTTTGGSTACSRPNVRIDIDVWSSATQNSVRVDLNNMAVQDFDSALPVRQNYLF